ncbi:MAG TPA: BlaI/MecI/CopY family transcriptional regulator [Phycisphaerae bacterium]|nr:BlaI/MecI/CopY family transcriptional regulator [Phycisphaerae bacterium]
MGKSTPHITAAELRILKVLWKEGPQTVRQVKDALTRIEGDEPAYTTVMTMMKSLADKGALEVDNSRQPFVYSPVVRRDQVMGQRVAQFLQNVFDGRAEDLVMHLAEKADLSAADLKRIEKKIADREKADRQSTSKPKSTSRSKRKKS